MPTYKDDARAVDTLNRFLEGHALRPPQLGNRRMMSAKISTAAHIGLKTLAKELGYTRAGSGNVSLLLEAIGTRTLTIMQPQIQARRQD